MDPQLTEKSPDGSIIIEPYTKSKDDDVTWQFWIRRQDTMTLLDAEPSDYPAGFRFSNDNHWRVRMQKTGAGSSTLFLYKQGPKGFVAATKRAIGDLAWDCLNTRPEFRKVEAPTFHISTGLVGGARRTITFWAWIGPLNRYLVFTLSGDVDANSKHRQLRSVHGWRCRYDLEKGSFDVHNAKALAAE
jgi:hypothetical protein